MTHEHDPQTALEEIRRETKKFLSDAASTLCIEAKRQSDLKLRHTHALELVANYLGYPTKAALDADIKADQVYLDPNTPDTLLPEWYRAQHRIGQRMGKLDNPNLRHIDPGEMTYLIRDSVTPACDFCGVTGQQTLPVRTGEDYNPHTRWICEPCVPQHPDEVGRCWACDDEVWDVDVLNHAGECPEHAGESSLTEEEQEDMDSYVEYHLNH